MTPEARARRKKIGLVIKAGRKQFGHTEQQLARALGVSQPTLHRYEQGQGRIPYEYLQEIGRQYSIPMHCFDRGIIERPGGALTESRLSLPPVYSRDRNSKVRIVRLFLNFLEICEGEEGYRRFLNSINVAPEFFVDMDNEVNVDFVNTVFEHLIRRRQLTRDTMKLLVFPASDALFHGVPGEAYRLASTVPTVVKSMVEHMHMYETKPNFYYNIEAFDTTYIELSVKPSSEFLSFKRPAVLGDVECLYLKELFLSQRNAVNRFDQDLDLTEHQCYFRGADRCIYRLEVV